MSRYVNSIPDVGQPFLQEKRPMALFIFGFVAEWDQPDHRRDGKERGKA